jgi:hypothetical protein
VEFPNTHAKGGTKVRDPVGGTLTAQGSIETGRRDESVKSEAVNRCKLSNCRCSILLTKISARLAQYQCTRLYVASINDLSSQLKMICAHFALFLLNGCLN